MNDSTEQPGDPDINSLTTADPALIWLAIKSLMPDVTVMIENMLINGKSVNEIMKFAPGSSLPKPAITGTMRAIAWRQKQIFGNRNIG